MQATFVRRNLSPQPVPAQPAETPTLKLLVVTARPGGARDVGYRTISRPLLAMVRDAALPVEVELLRPATYRSLVEYLERRKELQKRTLTNLYNVRPDWLAAAHRRLRLAGGFGR